jgi:hypothetical protein
MVSGRRDSSDYEREGDSTIIKWMNIQRFQCTGGRHRGQEPYHSQVIAARPFNEHTMLVKDNLL